MGCNFKSRFDQYNAFFLYGATPAAEATIELLDGMGKKILGFVDRAPEKQKALFLGYKVLSPEAFFGEYDGKSGIIIVSAYQMDIAAFLKQNSVASDCVFPHLDGMFFPTYQIGYDDNQQLDRVCEGLTNEEERHYFSGWRKFKQSGNLADLQPMQSMRRQYDHADWFRSIKSGGVAVDIGAYDGTSSVEFAQTGCFSKVIAIEPFINNYNMLCDSIGISKLDIPIEPQQMAIGAGRETLWQNTTNASSRATLNNTASGDGKKGEKIEIYALDDMNFTDISMIKVDIEGYELDFLSGAVETLSRCKPHLAISAYHHHSHAHKIPEFLSKHFENVRVWVGHHPLAVYELEYYVSFGE